jgi:hypothetical protein
MSRIWTCGERIEEQGDGYSDYGDFSDDDFL